MFFVPLLVAIALGTAIQRWANNSDIPAGIGLLIVIVVPIAGVVLPLFIFDVLPMMWAKRPLKRGDYATVMHRVEWLLRYRMRTPNAEGLKASVLFFQGQFGEAEAIWREYAKQVSSSISNVTPRRLENLGWAVMFQERYAEATEIFLAILEIKPAWIGAYLGLAEICLFQNQTPDHAALLAEQAAQLAGKWVERDRRGQIWATQGWALGRNRHHQASEDAIRKAVAYANSRQFSAYQAATLFRVAMTKREMGDLATASDYFDQVRTIDPQGFYGQRATTDLATLGMAAAVS
jgi:tetratricopeptide (TPR) repeat protein